MGRLLNCPIIPNLLSLKLVACKLPPALFFSLSLPYRQCLNLNASPAYYHENQAFSFSPESCNFCSSSSPCLLWLMKSYFLWPPWFLCKAFWATENTAAKIILLDSRSWMWWRWQLEKVALVFLHIRQKAVSYIQEENTHLSPHPMSFAKGLGGKTKDTKAIFPSLSSSAPLHSRCLLLLFEPVLQLTLRSNL